MSGRWAEARRILCVRLDSVGDVLMTEPAMRALRTLAPAAELTLLTSSAGARLAPMLEAVDETLVFEAPWMKPDVPDTQAEFALVEHLRLRRFDAAAIFTVWSQSALPAAWMARLAGIPLRLAHTRENAYGLLTHRVPDDEPHARVRHEVRRQLDLVAAVGATVHDERMRLSIPQRARDRVRALLPQLPPGPLVVVHAGATAASRRWPPERYAEVARALARAGCRVIFTGSGDEEEALVRAMQARMQGAPSGSMAGLLDLAGLAALIEAADLLLVNNTGPAHLAAATGTPVVVPYALTNPQHTPWSAAARVLVRDVPCRNCYRSVCPEGHHACLQDIPAQAVLQAALELLGRAPASVPTAPALPPAPARTRPDSPFETDAAPLAATPVPLVRDNDRRRTSARRPLSS